MSQKPLEGKVILVTGAGGGIGRAIAIEAARAGHLLGHIREIDRLFVEAAHILDLVALLAKMIQHGCFQRKPGMVRTDNNTHFETSHFSGAFWEATGPDHRRR